MRALALSLAFLAWLMAGCETSNNAGPCKGFKVFDDHEPGVAYELSVPNAILAAVFSETLVVPAVWATTVAFCPVSQ